MEKIKRKLKEASKANFLLLSIACFWLFAFSANSQGFGERFRVAPTYSIIDGWSKMEEAELIRDYDGYSVGIGIDYSFSENWSIGLELKRAQVLDVVSGVDEGATYLSYFLGYSFGVGKNGSLTPKLGLGLINEPGYVTEDKVFCDSCTPVTVTYLDYQSYYHYAMGIEYRYSFLEGLDAGGKVELFGADGLDRGSTIYSVFISFSLASSSDNE